MCAIKIHSHVAALVLLAAACSSSSSKTGSGGLDSGSEAGAARDTRTLDANADETGRRADARDASQVDIGREAGRAVDQGKSVDSGRDAADARDGAPGRDSDSDQVDAPADIAVDVEADAAPVGLGTCASPFLVPRTSFSADLNINTSGASRIFKIPCANNRADVVLKLEIDAPQMLVYADTLSATWNTALFFSQDCSKATPPPRLGAAACNDDACDTSQSQIAAVLDYGVHYLIVSGVDGESGEVTVHVERAIVGSHNLVSLDSGASSVDGTTVKGGDGTSPCEAVGPQENYWWMGCPDYVGGSLSASTCDGAAWDTALSLQVPRAQTHNCNDDDLACGKQSTLQTTVPPGAGINVLTVAGYTADDYGDYTLTYERP